MLANVKTSKLNADAIALTSASLTKTLVAFDEQHLPQAVQPNRRPLEIKLVDIS